MIALALAFTLACDSVRVCAGGDVTLGTNLDSTWGRTVTGITHGDWRKRLMSADSLLMPVRPMMSGADIVLFNAEGAFGDDPITNDKCTLKARRRRNRRALGPDTPSHCFALRQPAAAVAALRRLGDTTTVVVANVANNHAHDAGDDGFAHSVHLLRAAGVRVTGADTIPTLAVTARGDTIAILGFSAWSSPGVGDLSAVERIVARAVERYRRVIVTAHMGAEGVLAQRTGDSTEHYVGEDRGNVVAFARSVIDAGAVMVVGHGPHVLRAAEWRDSALVLYSLGNLVNYGPFALAEPARRGAVVCATLDSAGRPRDVRLAATVQPAQGIVSPDSTSRARMLVDSLSALDFPSTGVAVDSATGVVSRRPSSVASPAPSDSLPLPSGSPAPPPDSAPRPNPRE